MEVKAAAGEGFIGEGVDLSLISSMVKRRGGHAKREEEKTMTTWARRWQTLVKRGAAQRRKGRAVAKEKGERKDEVVGKGSGKNRGSGWRWEMMVAEKGKGFIGFFFFFLVRREG